MINNTACSLTDKHCVPCEGGISPLTEKEYAPMLQEIPGWHVVDEKKIEKTFQLKNFTEALNFINKVGQIAENEGHHPDIALFDWNNVKFSLATHAIKGLSENDFILASKINEAAPAKK